MKIVLFLLGVVFYLNANTCKSYYNPDKFYEAPEFLQGLIDETLNTLELFGSKISYLDSSFIKKDDFYFKNIKYKNIKEYIYPQENALWKLKTKNNKIDEINISRVELYNYDDSEIAQEINDNFEGFWQDWIEDAYEMQLLPEQTLFTYKEKYFTFSVFIYGVKKDATKLKGTVINYWLKDYTKEVQTYKQCIKE